MLVSPMMLTKLCTKITTSVRGILTNTAIRAYSAQSNVPQFETLAVSVPKKHVFHVELNRPDKINTFSRNMWIELKQCFMSLNENSECRVVVLSGRGKHFTGGIDLSSMMELSSETDNDMDPARRARFLLKFITAFQDGITCLEKCVKPVLTVSHNACVGAGVDLITAADIRYCTEDAWFQVKEVDIGLAADVGTLQRLPKVIGSTSIARELCFTARKVHAIEALHIGLVSKVYPNQDTALKEVLTTAETIATKSPVAVQTTKQNLVYSQSRTNEDGLMHISLLNQLMLQSEDLSKAAIAQATKSGPVEFDDL